MTQRRQTHRNEVNENDSRPMVLLYEEVGAGERGKGSGRKKKGEG